MRRQTKNNLLCGSVLGIGISCYIVYLVLKEHNADITDSIFSAPASKDRWASMTGNNRAGIDEDLDEGLVEDTGQPAFPAVKPEPPKQVTLEDDDKSDDEDSLEDDMIQPPDVDVEEQKEKKKPVVEELLEDKPVEKEKEVLPPKKVPEAKPPKLPVVVNTEPPVVRKKPHRTTQPPPIKYKVEVPETPKFKAERPEQRTKPKEEKKERKHERVDTKEPERQREKGPEKPDKFVPATTETPESVEEEPAVELPKEEPVVEGPVVNAESAEEDDDVGSESEVPAVEEKVDTPIPENQGTAPTDLNVKPDAHKPKAHHPHQHKPKMDGTHDRQEVVPMKEAIPPRKQEVPPMEETLPAQPPPQETQQSESESQPVENKDGNKKVQQSSHPNRVDWERFFSFIPNGLQKCPEIFPNLANSNPLPPSFQRAYKEYESQLESVHIRNHNIAEHMEQFIVYYFLVRAPFMRTVCETGFGAGHSAFLWLQANPDVHVYSFDLGEHDYSRPVASYLNDKFKNRLHVTWGDSVKTLPQFRMANPDIKCDIVVIDGGHTFRESLSDYFHLRRLVTSDNVVLLDNYPDVSEDYMLALGNVWEGGKRRGELIEIFHCDYRPQAHGFSVGRFIMPKPTDKH